VSQALGDDLYFTDRLAWIRKWPDVAAGLGATNEAIPALANSRQHWVALGPLGAYGKAPEAPTTVVAGAFLCPGNTLTTGCVGFTAPGEFPICTHSGATEPRRQSVSAGGVLVCDSQFVPAARAPTSLERLRPRIRRRLRRWL
jgi:hypothetical protein